MKTAQEMFNQLQKLKGERKTLSAVYRDAGISSHAGPRIDCRRHCEYFSSNNPDSGADLGVRSENHRHICGDSYIWALDFGNDGGLHARSVHIL